MNRSSTSSRRDADRAPRPPFALACAFAMAVAAFVSACTSSRTVRVGFVGDLFSELGVGGRNGAELAVETLDAAPGAHAHYELLVEDDRNDADTMRAAVASFAARDTAFVVGPMTSTMAVAAVPEADRLKLVLISPTATTDALSGKDDWFFRTAADAPTGARDLARVLHDRGVRTIVVLMDVANGAYTASFGHAVATEFLRLGGRSAPEFGYWSGKSLEFAAAMDRADADKPDAVVLVNSPSDAAVATQHLRRSLPHALIALSPWGANSQFLQIGGASTEGAIGLQAVDLASPLPRMRDFFARYRARFGEAPTTPAVQAYEAVMLGVDALDRGGPNGLRETLATPGRRPGLDGEFTMDANGDAQRAMHPIEVRGGHFEPMRP